MNELPEAIYQQIESLSAEGGILMAQRDFVSARSIFNQAYKLVPYPKHEWAATTWLMAAIGEACFYLGDYEQGRKALDFGMACPGGLGNPFMHLRFGQCEYELGNLDRAADELARAYLPEGVEVFSNDDPKYLKFIKGRLNEPSGGWPEGW